MSPSGRLPSCLTNPDGSLVAGMLKEPKDRQMMSFGTWCLAILYSAFLHTIACMEALNTHLVTAWTTVWGTQSQTKSHTDSNTHCFVIKPETTVSNRESQKPISTMWRY